MNHLTDKKTNVTSEMTSLIRAIWRYARWRYAKLRCRRTLARLTVTVLRCWYYVLDKKTCYRRLIFSLTRWRHTDTMIKNLPYLGLISPGKRILQVTSIYIRLKHLLQAVVKWKLILKQVTSCISHHNIVVSSAFISFFNTKEKAKTCQVNVVSPKPFAYFF